jgi:peroxiredoxin
MYPHERSLVKRLANKPFALIGVNSDRDLEALKKVMETEKITWRSFQNDYDRNNAISRAWKVRSWPSLFLIDHTGVIREFWKGNPGEKVLDNAIDKLVAAAEADTKGKGKGKEEKDKDGGRQQR